MQDVTSNQMKQLFERLTEEKVFWFCLAEEHLTEL